MKNISKFFSIPTYLKDNDLLSYSIFVILGKKNIGKSYSACLEIWKNEWEQKQKGTCYCFRTKIEAEQFIAQEFYNVFDSTRYEIKKNMVYDKELKLSCGMIASITTSKHIKNNENISNLIIDEFNEVDGFPIKNEYRKFLRIYGNLRRGKDNFKLYLLGNSKDLFNIFFIMWGIWNETQIKDEINIFNERLVLINLPYIKYSNDDKDGDFKFLSKFDNEYYEMSFYNKFAFNDTRMILLNNNIEVNNLYNIIINSNKYTISTDAEDKLIVHNYQSNNLSTYSLKSKDNVYNNIRYDNENIEPLIKNLIINNQNKNLFFTNNIIKTNILDYLSLYIKIIDI